MTTHPDFYLWKNNLGKLMMKLRSELRESTPSLETNSPLSIELPTTLHAMIDHSPSSVLITKINLSNNINTNIVVLTLILLLL